jgi:hypothetical protein
MLFITRGSTDTPLKAVSFATAGTDEFLESVFKIDEHNFLARMEGFAIQGLKGELNVNKIFPIYEDLEGTADNYKKTLSKRRAEIRAEILQQLREFPLPAFYPIYI